MSSFNYSALSDYEFELFCRDVMQRHLNTSLRTFSKGRDGGIDITDDPVNPKIVVQVKHYVYSPLGTLKKSIINELSKVESIKPQQYYICCSRTLSREVIKEIYDTYKDYMDSSDCIITQEFFDDFLSKECNVDILRKHFKLWFCSDSVLKLMHNRAMFVDCEYLFYNIEQDSKTFVQTDVYDKCISALEQQPVLFLLGLPGVGKSIMTEMIALSYSRDGYKIKYVANNGMVDLKNSLSVDENEKELVLVDDCLGQLYFNLSERQGHELLSLIVYISTHENKKMILNSRVTVFNEATESFMHFKRFVDKKKNYIRYINVDDLTVNEKAMILYNKLYHNGIYEKYRERIKMNRNYRKIVLHRNYSPRIMEYITNPNNINTEDYFGFAMECLDNPYEVWKNEIENRIGLSDRIFIYTLFSLTESMVDESLLKEAYYSRIKSEPGIDSTVSLFESVEMRLNESIIKIIDKDGVRHVSVINPSVNDYIRHFMKKNSLENERIITTSTHYNQFLRIDDTSFVDVVKKRQIDNYAFDSYQQKLTATIYYIVKYGINDDVYSCMFQEYYEMISNDYVVSILPLISNQELFVKSLVDEVDSFYASRSMISDDMLSDYLYNLSREEWEDLIISIDKYDLFWLYDKYRDLFIISLNEFLDYYVDNVYNDHFYRNYSPSDFVEDWPELIKEEFNNTKRIVENRIIDDLKEDYDRLTLLLPVDIRINLDFNPDSLSICLDDLDDYLLEEKRKLESDVINNNRKEYDCLEEIFR